jgi:hypothetical protein
MSMIPTRKDTDAKIIGVGGIRCYCCVVNHRKTKIASRRRLRHAVKAEIREGKDE